MIDVRKLVHIASLSKFEAGKVIIEEGSQDSNGMYIVLSGTVGVFINYGTKGQTELARLCAGQIFGEMSMFNELPRSATNTAIDNVTAVFLTRENFLDFVIKNPDVTFQIIGTLCERIYNFNMAFGAQALQVAAKSKEQIEQEHAAALPREKRLPPGTASKFGDFIRLVPAPALSNIRHKPERELTLPSHVYFGLLEPEEYEKHISKNKMFCPVCDAIILENTIMESELEPLFCTPDLRQTYKNFNRAWYDVRLCPACYYAGLVESFENIPSQRKKILSIMLQNLRKDVDIKFSNVHDIDEVLITYYIALVSSSYVENPLIVQAKIWQRIHWLYEDAGNLDLAREAAKKALSVIQQLYSKDILNDSDEQEFCLIAAELAMKMEEKATAKDFFFRVMAKKDENPAYIAQAKERMQVL